MTMMSVTFEVMFRVAVEVEKDEVVCVVGDCDRLGNWDPHHAVVLTRESSSPSQCRKNKQEDSVCKDGKQATCDVWRKRVKLCGMKNYCYRYFVCQIMESDSESTDKSVKVIRWETNIAPRIFSPSDYMQDPHKYDATIETFGEYGGKFHVTKGWLTDQLEIHIRMHGNPIRMWKPKYRKQTYRIKCTPIDQRYQDHLDEDEEEDEWGTHVSPPATFTKVLVSTLDNRKMNHCVQNQHGTVFEPDGYMIFTAETVEPESLGFQFDFYVDEEGVNPRHVGYCYLLPVDLKKSNDSKTVPITGLNHKPIGKIALDYLIVKPVPGLDLKMDVSYQNYWKFERKSLDVGHRGMGSSYKHKKLAAVRENTVQSLQDAASHGADFVEFDVQLSKDMIPVIYHDFHVAITYRKKKREELEFYQASVKDLTLAELQSMKLTHTSRISENDRDGIHDDDIDPSDLQPFPTLERVFEAVNPCTGFNVEIKYPQEKVNGEFEEINYHDRNKYVDIILRVVLRTAGRRRVVFSSFDPDICTLLQRKQNKYPTLFLTNGEDKEKYVPYLDLRTRSIDMAIHFATFSNILGIDVLTSTLFQNMDKIENVKKAKLVLFCWGEDNNDSNAINTLKQNGVDGIIYDRIDFFKTGQKSVFAVEREQTEKILKTAGLLSPNAGLQALELSPSGSDLENGTTILHIAVANNNSDIVKLLLRAGADVKTANNQGRTPLHIASRSGNADITKQLIDAGSDVDATTKDCRTALHTATWRGHTDVVRLLVEANADVNIHDGDSWTPLFWAAKLNYRQITQLLVEHGANLNHRIVNKEYTALHEAVRNGHIGLSKYLIHEGADVNLKAKDEGILEFLLKTQHFDPKVFTDMMDFCILHDYKLCRESISKKVLSVKSLQECEEIHDWLQRVMQTVPSLSAICRNFLRQQLSSCMKTQIQKSIEKLPLPPLLKDYLAFKDEECESLLKISF
ncbi:glycerophosphocholine phosphodiesterase GPCPD1-like [Saccostrea echinata]|uniref:glycerophosphocholine phosphodiesterase GPCPD1-like n=1 Tax=Saccostrea echinata TaxID=191078 RepID=UPI002A804117|nr:glycerophosphocholine phosphodiesterase GPCPD1-like [Saccostrea echinata]